MPYIIIQIDECLLRGKRLYHRGRILTGDQNILGEDMLEWHALNAENHVEMNPQRTGGIRITGPCIFGMVECHKQPDGSYKSEEVRLFKVERRTSAILLPIIRQHVAPGTVVWSDEWASYSRIGQYADGLVHESVNHSVELNSTSGVHTQNI
ncbi:hypothetical protein RF11_06895 [Thelohanellus kitauei]|uniref:ISXO2-like transposase domain-containing protein n=1 Tax=Thelohanellus kitauei TaxID=669202 RepID=A0A0C2MJ28_THEKT|nr:hypothetical protein RF11_06895 [Thelohanellus kitauei]